MRALVLLAALLLLPSAALAHVPEREAEVGVTGALGRAAQAGPPLTATPRAQCGPGSRPETGIQGRVPASARAGFTCNLSLVGREGEGGGFKVVRYVDKAGNECAYYDTTLLFPLNAQNLGDQPTGVAVLDMANPAKPVRTATLATPAMQSPHESLVLNEKRGLLAAVLGNATTYPGIVDLYDLTADCRHPVLQSSAPVGFLGHESGFAPDGRTLYTTSLFDGHVTAIDVTDPKLPRPLGVYDFPSHGMTVSDDGRRGYLASLGIGVQIVDLSEVQDRKPNPQVREISRVTWPSLTIPQVAHPVTIGGHPYLVEIDEFSTNKDGENFPAENGPRVGAGRIIDIADEKAPKVVSNLRLEVDNPEHRAEVASDPGAQSFVQGYAGHYCNVPSRTDPGIVACSFIASGLRVFDIRDPLKPRELAYFVAPAAGSKTGGEPSNYAMSSPSFVPARREIWYSDGNTGFYALRAAEGVWPFGASPSLGLPTTKRCASRRSFTIRLRAPKGDGLRSARVVVNGRRVRVLRGKRLRARVNLRGLPRGTVRVKIVAVTRSGRTITSQRRYHTCVLRTRG